MAGLQERVLIEHGPTARIVAAERVRVGGIGGFFARQHYEVTVEVDEVASEMGKASGRRRGAHAKPDAAVRLGIAALLDDADEREARIQAAQAEEVVSTDSDVFAAIMDDLTFNTLSDAQTPVAQAAPRPLGGAGDLVVIIGLGADALSVARAMAAAGPGMVVTAGALAGGVPDLGAVTDRRTAFAARASGVAGKGPVFVAFGLDAAERDHARNAAVVGTFAADQAWLAVDAGRKPADTARWVGEVAGLLPVDAVAVVGAASTSTPESVSDLGLPIGWDDAGSHA